MPENSSNQDPFSDLWKLWLTHPWLQSWMMWNKWWWAANPLSRLIPLDWEEIYRALMRLGDDLTARPELMEERTAELLRAYNELALWGVRRYVSQEHGEPVVASKEDRRFQDEAWTRNFVFSAIKQSYLVMSAWLYATGKQLHGLDPRTYQRVNFYIRQFVDALSPTNFWLTNPAVLRETLDTGGENLRRGMQNLLDDLKRGEISVAGRQHFTIGKNLALTPGQVIFRNDLAELIQYTPTTDQVYRVPIVMIPPWINKYYVMDMRPGRSMVEYLVQRGFTVFMISWRNPTAAMEHLTMEDYLRFGPLECAQAAQRITGSPKINLLGYCLGGTLLAITLAYLGAVGDATANSGTFFTTLQDFSEVGETAIFLSEEWVAEVEKRSASRGYLDAIEMGSVFRLLRSNDLVWNFVINNYLLGKEPLAFDLMFWSVDGTRMPRVVHSYYLRNCYLENNLIKPNAMTMFGQGLDLSRVQVPCYVVAGLEDHIVPWRSAHRAGALFAGATRLILGAGGHITAIINPPSANKGLYFSNESATTNSDQWLKSAKRNEGSWWHDWAKWLGAISGEKTALPPMGNAEYQPIVAAPGTYVLEE